ncbi:hypothetical protein IG631_17893 [Alternaria alternata]|nr:hypothetical protein IG631_17893 [Alternaria alternata]
MLANDRKCADGLVSSFHLASVARSNAPEEAVTIVTSDDCSFQSQENSNASSYPLDPTNLCPRSYRHLQTATCTPCRRLVLCLSTCAIPETRFRNGTNAAYALGARVLRSVQFTLQAKYERPF